MFGFPIQMMEHKEFETFEISGIDYTTSIFECDRCNNYSMKKPHNHVYLKENTSPVQPRKHQGQQHMMAFKSTDEDIDCTKGDEDGYCNCTPFWFNISAQKRLQTLEEYGVEWDPAITF